MAKRLTERQILTTKLESLTDAEVSELVDYLSIMESMRSATKAPTAREDDLVALLAEAQESKRARQAFEWEVVRRRAERRAMRVVHDKA